MDLCVDCHGFQTNRARNVIVFPPAIGRETLFLRENLDCDSEALFTKHSKDSGLRLLILHIVPHETDCPPKGDAGRPPVLVGSFEQFPLSIKSPFPSSSMLLGMLQRGHTHAPHWGYDYVWAEGGLNQMPSWKHRVLLSFTNRIPITEAAPHPNCCNCLPFTVVSVHKALDISSSGELSNRYEFLPKASLSSSGSGTMPGQDANPGSKEEVAEASSCPSW